MTFTCAGVRLELGIYLLGAIEPRDRAIVQRHLDACAGCREELASLAGLPALLRRISDAESVLASAGPGEDDAPLPPAALLSRTARIRHRHRALATAAAAGMIAGTAAAVSLVNHGVAQTQTAVPAVPAWQRTVQAASPATGVWARVRYASRPWGTQIEAQISGVRTGTRCQLWVTGPGGQRLQAGGWVIAAGQAGSWYPGSSPLPATRLSSFEITSVSKTLVKVTARDSGNSAERR
jgi:hypothetical protein